MSHSSKSQNGNILFIILIAVALFAALCYVLSNSMRSSGNASGEKSLIGTSEITQYASAIENAVMMLKVSKQCAIEQISFERPPFDGSDNVYVNSNSPNDFSCHVFHPNGGKVSVQQPTPGTNDGREWAFVDRTVMKIGADQTACGPDCNELLMVLGGMNESACKMLNKKIIGTEEIPVMAVGGNYDQSYFDGIFEMSDYIGYGADEHSRLCILDDFGIYYYYHVLMPR